MKLTSQYKLYIAIAVAVVIIAAAVALLIVPKFSERGDLKAQMSDVEQQIQTNEALLKKRQETKQRAAITDAELLQLANQVPESPELPALIIELQDAVNESGLYFSAIAPDAGITRGSPGSSDSAANAAYWTTGITLDVVGTWQDTVDLLQRLRRITRQIRIVSLEVTPENEESSTDTTVTVEMPNEVRTTLSIEVYTIPSESDAAAPAAPAAPSQ